MGIDPGHVMGVASLEEWAGEPVTNDEYGRLWLAMAETMGDEYFGLGARPMRPGSFTLMGHAVLDARNLEQGLRRVLRFFRLVLDDPWGELRMPGGAVAEIVLHDSRGAGTAFADRTLWLLIMGLCCWLIGRRIPLRRIDFTGPAPDNRAEYLQFFGAPVRFGAEQSLLAFDARYLSMPNIRNLPQLRSFLRGAPANILVRYRHDQGLTGRVRTRLTASEAQVWPTMEEMAAEFGLSPATLRRHLRAEGQGFVTIRDEILQTRAERLLTETTEGVAQIALELGYSEPGAFHRAFRKWTGLSPGAFRKLRDTDA